MARKTNDPNHPCSTCEADCTNGWMRLAWGDGEYECRKPAEYRTRLKAEEDAHYDRMAQDAQANDRYEAGVLPY